MPGRCNALLIALAVVVLGASPARAEEGARDPFEALSGQRQRGPITIKSDSLELDYRGATLTYLGSVHVTQGDMVLTSDRLAITFDQGVLEGTPPEGQKPERVGRVRDRIREIVADGNVRMEQDQRVASGQRAVFDHANQTIVLSGEAVLEEGPNQVSGERIVVYLNEQRSVVESGSKSRVQAVLYPDTVDSEALAPEVPEAEAAAVPPVPPGTLADSRARTRPGAGDGSQ